MSIVNKFVPAVDAISVIILVCVSHSEDEPKPPAGVNALAAESATEEKSRPAAEAKSSSREYFRVNLIDRAKVVEWLRANGYSNYVIVPEPRPNKTLVMQLLKKGVEIPGCTLEPSTRGKKMMKIEHPSSVFLVKEGCDLNIRPYGFHGANRCRDPPVFSFENRFASSSTGL